ncbi:MAG: hypothetical protein WH035_02305 [Spirochaetota bacterium]
MANKVNDNIRKSNQKKGVYQNHLSKEPNFALNTILKFETCKNPNPILEII